jgi:hypothetical protein
MSGQKNKKTKKQKAKQTNKTKKSQCTKTKALYHPLHMGHQIVKGDNGQFCFQMHEFAQMMTSVAIFCLEALLYAVHISQCWKTSLQMELTTLGEIPLLIIVLETKECCLLSHSMDDEAGVHEDK